MAQLRNNKPEGTFISILADGSMRMVVPEGTEGAVKREYETSDEKKGVKHEIVYTELEGLIKGVKFFEGDFGKLLQIAFSGEPLIILSVSTESSYGEDLMKKLPNIDITKEVKLVPYSFEDLKGKKRKGVTVYQDGNKIESYYYGVGNDGKKTEINGYPEVKLPKGKKTMSKDDWKLYFMTARKFLIEKIEEIFKITEEKSEAEVDEWGDEEK